jgi:hypothetical protein
MVQSTNNADMLNISLYCRDQFYPVTIVQLPSNDWVV